jgi:hypothetical protein
MQGFSGKPLQRLSYRKIASPFDSASRSLENWRLEPLYRFPLAAQVRYCTEQPEWKAKTGHPAHHYPGDQPGPTWRMYHPAKMKIIHGIDLTDENGPVLPMRATRRLVRMRNRLLNVLVTEA